MEVPFSYKLKITQEKIGKTELTLECLEDLNHTIDTLFEYLERSGQPQLLETLCPYFGVIWPSGRALAEHMSSLGPELLRGARILEVGCGLALPSLVTSKLGADVTATDFHPEVSRFLERNIALNQIESLRYLKLDWTRDLAPAQPGYDWVIGSDVLYERQHSEQVAQVVARQVAPGGTILIADPGRPYLQNFADALKREGFRLETLARGEIFLLRFTRPTPDLQP